MDFFDYQQQQLCAENVTLNAIADEYGTPCYVYSKATIERHWKAFDDALSGKPHLVCYAVKANSNLAVLNVLAQLGSGFDIVSKGELQRVLAAGGEASKIVFSGVGKSRDDILFALEQKIRCFNIESEQELERLNEIATENNSVASVSFRVNPDVDAKTHPYISTGLKDNKFGIPIDEAPRIYARAATMSAINIVGIDCHIGSQLTELSPFVDALDRLLILVKTLSEQGIEIKHLDLGGGLGICYNDEKPPSPSMWAEALTRQLAEFDGEIIIEPGRAIVGNAGILLTRIEYLKLAEHKNFAVVDAAMNDLMRPSLYGAWQNIVEVDLNLKRDKRVYDVVGPICETGDFLGKERELSIEPNDLLAVRSAGAYGFTMSSNYNSRPRVAEVMVDDAQHHLIRARENFEMLIQGEKILSK
ncbi:MAG: diaminopimelate decarboxylase [Gammaproteobacteria bacterium]|nr:diaminopimelate decarboxylase [Gammaproteobacteria bacterium]